LYEVAWAAMSQAALTLLTTVTSSQIRSGCYGPTIDRMTRHPTVSLQADPGRRNWWVMPHPRNWRRVRNFGLRRSAAIAGPLTGGEMRFGPGRENT
jgi:hypothetical protein